MLIFSLLVKKNWFIGLIDSWSYPVISSVGAAQLPTHGRRQDHNTQSTPRVLGDNLVPRVGEVPGEPYERLKNINPMPN